MTVNEREAGVAGPTSGHSPSPAGKGWDVRIARDRKLRGGSPRTQSAPSPSGARSSPPPPGRTGYAAHGLRARGDADAGSTWRAATPPSLAATDIRAVRFLDPAKGRRGVSGTERQSFSLRRTSDGGLTWTASRLPVPAGVDAGAPISLAAPDASHLFIGLSLHQGLGLPGPGVLLV